MQFGILRLPSTFMPCAMPTPVKSDPIMAPNPGIRYSILRQSGQFPNLHLDNLPAARWQSRNIPHQRVIDFGPEFLGLRRLAPRFAKSQQPLWCHARPTSKNQQLILGRNRLPQQTLSCRVHGDEIPPIAAVELPRQICRPSSARGESSPTGSCAASRVSHHDF